MFAKVLKYKRVDNCFSYPTEDSIDVIMLDHPHEVGDIINGQLIVNCDMPWRDEVIYKYNAGQYAKVVKISYIDIFVTDKNHDDKKFLIKYGTRYEYFNGKDILVNIYGI